MALTTLHPNAALIVVDLPQGIAGYPFIHSIGVSLALDAMTDTRPEAHDYCVRNLFPRLGETGTIQEIIDLLLTRSA
jgi:hypothetical protein